MSRSYPTQIKVKTDFYRKKKKKILKDILPSSLNLFSLKKLSQAFKHPSTFVFEPILLQTVETVCVHDVRILDGFEQKFDKPLPELDLLDLARPTILEFQSTIA